MCLLLAPAAGGGGSIRSSLLPGASERVSADLAELLPSDCDKTLPDASLIFTSLTLLLSEDGPDGTDGALHNGPECACPAEKISAFDA